MKTQEEIFNNIGSLTRELKWLGRYVQNDLEYMIQNSDINLESLKQDKSLFIEDVQTFVDNLYEVCKDISDIYDNCIINYANIKGETKWLTN